MIANESTTANSLFSLYLPTVSAELSTDNQFYCIKAQTHFSAVRNIKLKKQKAHHEQHMDNVLSFQSNHSKKFI